MVPLLAILALSAAEGAEVERRLAAMGTELMVQVTARDRATALAASEAAVHAVERTEARLSIWRSESELSRLNNTPVGAWFEVSPALAEDLELALLCHRETGGAFDPTVGSTVPGLHHLELDQRRRRARRTAAVTVDPGGFGKGIGLDAALAAATEAGAIGVVVDLGGQVAVSGTVLGVDVADPADRGRVVATLEISGGSVATSGHSERPGHLVDPVSGGPTPDYGSVTVRAPSAARADCLSTGLYVLGPQGALSHAPEGVEVVVVEHGATGPHVQRKGGTP